jgi:transcriptional regulator with XRE-family HTH domain
MDTVFIKSHRQQIGHILRLYREKRGRNQTEIAESAGISTSMLSQIERGAVSPSLDTLFAVCSALNLELVELFGRLSPREAVHIVHPSNRLVASEAGVRYEQLITSLDPSFAAELFLLEVGVGERAGLSDRGHEGVEMGYVLSGSAILEVEHKSYTLEKGDSVTFAARLPHSLSNQGSVVFKAVWAALPPHRDYLESEAGSPGAGQG